MVVAQGLTLPFEDETNIRKDFLETFDYCGEKQLITYETKEWSAVCPFSGLPDYGTLKIEYVPNKKIVELKSLKYYIVSYRNIGIYQEPATNRLFTDIFSVLAPQFLVVTTIYNTRGGIDATCRIEKGIP
ncbi:NADPH-dependent 7-cyano-7-deazaguanine reductase QueF [bacterium]|nr:NADPH-dependent 7-cyano-7-deazaguanine reductase QueF [bacterium]